jgi:glycosyltransferase involved in cell wall biosynthesis
MKVALLSRAAHPLHPPGGMERAVFSLAKHLRREGIEVVLFTRPATRTGAFPGEVVPIRYGSLHAIRHGRVLDRALLYPGFSKRVGAAVAERVRRGEIDVVDAQGLTALGYGRLRAQDASLRAPLLMNPQGLEEHKTSGLKRLALLRLRALSKEAARLSDRVIATDDVLREEVWRLLGIDPERVTLLPNGIDPEDIQPTPAPIARRLCEAYPALAAARPLLVSVGRLEAYKGFGDAARALQQLQARGALTGPWAWALVGQGPERRNLIPLVEALQGHGHLLGRVSEPLLHALYARADLFVHATRFEGSSLVTLEAMAHGLPVVATRAGGIPDKVVHGETGLLVAPGDVPALTGALAALLGDPARRADMGRRGRERALDRFGWPSLARRAVSLYEDLLREARR